jgi:hypothetical protein
MKIFIGFLLAVSVVVFGIFFATPSSQGQKQQKDEPTTVQKGKATAEEKVFSEEYKKLYVFREEKKLTDLKQEGGIGITIGSGSRPNSTDVSVATENQFLEKLTCEADAVVVGKVNKKQSHLSADETFVYTSYEFQIRRVIKNNFVSHIEVNNFITVTRPGGFIKIDEQVIQFDDASYKPLELNKEYLLFLKFIPEANGYKVFNSQSDFVFENNTFKRLSKRKSPNEPKGNINSEMLLNVVQGAVLANCDKSLSGGNQENE